MNFVVVVIILKMLIIPVLIVVHQANDHRPEGWVGPFQEQQAQWSYDKIIRTRLGCRALELGG